MALICQTFSIIVYPTGLCIKPYVLSYIALISVLLESVLQAFLFGFQALNILILFLKKACVVISLPERYGHWGAYIWLHDQWHP